jgi:EAL domain-containing protein (putative c-di-GMP-specific phosphodiesterase class I)
LVPQGPVDPRSALTAMGGTTCTWDLATDALAWGPNAAEILGVPHIGIDPTGSAFADAVEPGCGIGRGEAILAAETGDEGSGVPYVARYTLRIKADRFVHVEETGRWHADVEGRPALAHGVLRITASGVRPETLNAGLKARASLLTQIVDDVVEAQRSRHAMTLVVGTCDPDDEESEALMARIAQRVRPLMRRRDRFAVYGSARFALALASCPGSEAESATRRIFSLIDAPALRDEAPIRHLRLGAASAPDHAVDAPELLRRAEEALASIDGRSKGFALYDSKVSRGAGAERVGTTACDLIDALNDRRLVLTLAPVADARSRSPVFVEALPRLKGAEGGILPAGDIAAAAARNELSLLLEGRVLEQAAEYLAACPLERVAIRVSPQSLHDGEWLTTLAAHLGARPGIESRLIVDIPESALATPAVRGRLDAMKALGVATMLSGFGAGHASVKHLGSLPVDMLKIDGAFIQALPSGIEYRQHVRSLIDLAHHFGIIAVAEGVDDGATARLLAAWGIDCLQGAACGAPVLLEWAGPESRRSGAA